MPNPIETTDASASNATPYTLTPGDAINGELTAPGDHDWYRIELIAGETYTFGLTGAGDMVVPDTYLRLFDGTSTQIAFDDDSGPGAVSTGCRPHWEPKRTMTRRWAPAL
jgi:hypothetical protein